MVIYRNMTEFIIILSLNMLLLCNTAVNCLQFGLELQSSNRLFEENSPTEKRPEQTISTHKTLELDDLLSSPTEISIGKDGQSENLALDTDNQSGKEQIDWKLVVVIGFLVSLALFTVVRCIFWWFLEACNTQQRVVIMRRNAPVTGQFAKEYKIHSVEPPPHQSAHPDHESKVDADFSQRVSLSSNYADDEDEGYCEAIRSSVNVDSGPRYEAPPFPYTPLTMTNNELDHNNILVLAS